MQAVVHIYFLCVNTCEDLRGCGSLFNSFSHSCWHMPRNCGTKSFRTFVHWFSCASCPWKTWCRSTSSEAQLAFQLPTVNFYGPAINDLFGDLLKSNELSSFLENIAKSVGGFTVPCCSPLATWNLLSICQIYRIACYTALLEDSLETCSAAF